MDKNFDFDILDETPDYTGNPFEAQYREKIQEYEAKLKEAKTERIITNVASALIAGAVVGGISNIKLKNAQKKAEKRVNAAWDSGYEYGKALTTYAANNYLDGYENGVKLQIQNKT